MLHEKSVLPGGACRVTAIVLLLTVSVTASAQDTTPATPATTAAATEAAPAVAAADSSETKEARPSPATGKVATAGGEHSATASTHAQPSPTPVCKRQIYADVTALAQPFMLNRLGAAIPQGMVFALTRDMTTSAPGGQPQLRSGKRPRPIVLRANVGDCLNLTFTNLIKQYQPPPPPASPTPTPTPAAKSPATTETSIHVQGMQVVASPTPSPTPSTPIQNDGSFIGSNQSGLLAAPPPAAPTRTYTLYAQEEGTFLLYTMGDTSTAGEQLLAGLFGSVNVQPEGAEWYRSQVTAEDMKLSAFNANRLPQGASLNCATDPCKLTITKGGATTTAAVKRASDGTLLTGGGHPLINYDALYPADYDTTRPADFKRACTPILKMLDRKRAVVQSGGTSSCQDAASNKLELFHSDLTAIITGPSAGAFPQSQDSPVFAPNPASPNRREPYREITTIYHEVNNNAVQAFPQFYRSQTSQTVQPGIDGFAINYGTGGIGSEILANRLGLGPMGGCVDCKYEEFFLSSWAVGDPAMVVDVPANALVGSGPNPACGQTDKTVPNNKPKSTLLEQDQAYGAFTPCSFAQSPPALNEVFPNIKTPMRKATVAFFPDDPSNVYHSYLNDHVKFRILHGGTGVTHVHHQHAHQWLQSPNSDDSAYLDSQMISPGASYTLEMVYNGSGNRNKTLGDSIFHCHFYPHFAAGMWSLWRVHDVFESGTCLAADGKNVATASGTQMRPCLSGGEPITPGTPGGPIWNRALPDGEIAAGTPIPALVPIPTLAMAPLPARVRVVPATEPVNANAPAGPQRAVGFRTEVAQEDLDNGINPGFPFFIPGIAGARAPHPPLDFAPDGKGGFFDGGLPRHIVKSGSLKVEQHTNLDWSKDAATLSAEQLPEDGTQAEKVAMKYNGLRNHQSFTPGGQQGFFVVNGLPRKTPDNPLGAQPGAPYADPGVDDDGTAVGNFRRYKGAAIQRDVVLNKQGWHFPQQRMLALWGDVLDTMEGRRKPEPLFFRATSQEVVEFWHTNLVPNYYELDDFQVRTPTDIIGQHIHLVKFDVTSSDGAANGFNYEDGTFSPEEVRDIIAAINAGSWKPLPNVLAAPLQAKPPPAEIIPCLETGGVTPDTQKLCQEWTGAQTTIQRWYVDSLLNNKGEDRTIRTVFTHDHFGPSTHQQAGLYAGLVTEPENSQWRNSETGEIMGGAGVPPVRFDGGPTSWKADIWTTDDLSKSYREFLLEFQDFQLAYQKNSYPLGPDWQTPTMNSYRGSATTPGQQPTVLAIRFPPVPLLVSTGPIPGTQSVNYFNEPVPFRVAATGASNTTVFGDLSFAYNSSYGLNSAKTAYQLNSPTPAGDPATPLLRAYVNDNIQIRTLVGAHMLPHFFTIHGTRWLFEPSWADSGYRSTQGMGLSEHFELLFKAPPVSAANPAGACPDGTSQTTCADYLYAPDAADGAVTNGMWGIFRAYNFNPATPAANLKPLPNNMQPLPAISPGSNLVKQVCDGLPPSQVKNYNITATTSQQALNNQPIVFNARGQGVSSATQVVSPYGIMFVRSEDLYTAQDCGGTSPPPNCKAGTLKPNVPVEPLVLRAAAGDCINVKLTNQFDPNATVFSQKFPVIAPFNQKTNLPAPYKGLKLSPSTSVGIHAQLLSYDVMQNNGVNVGYNADQVVAACNPLTAGSPCSGSNPTYPSRTYQWYAGNIELNPDGSPKPVPIELGSLNLIPSDALMQHSNAMFGQMIIEPAGSTWVEDFQPGKGGNTRASATVTRGYGSTFRDFAVMFHDHINLYTQSGTPPTPTLLGNTNAVNYRTEPSAWRYSGGTLPTDTSAALADQTVCADPQTPVFSAPAGMPVRFRMTHPAGLGNEVFSLHGHVWQRQPYTKNSTEIGDNRLAQWMGSRDNFGSGDHYDLVVSKAGGEEKVAGDYLYTAFLPADASTGLWGIFRVAQEGKDAVTITNVTPFSSAGAGSIAGVNTVLTSGANTGLFAGSVTVSANGTQIGTANVNPFTGTWSLNCPANCTIPSGGIGNQPAITVQSAGGGVAQLNSGVVGTCPVGAPTAPTPLAAPRGRRRPAVAPAPSRPAPKKRDDLERFRQTSPVQDGQGQP